MRRKPKTLGSSAAVHRTQAEQQLARGDETLREVREELNGVAAAAPGASCFRALRKLGDAQSNMARSQDHLLARGKKSQHNRALWRRWGAQDRQLDPLEQRLAQLCFKK